MCLERLWEIHCRCPILRKLDQLFQKTVIHHRDIVLLPTFKNERADLLADTGSPPAISVPRFSLPKYPFAAPKSPRFSTGTQMKFSDVGMSAMMLIELPSGMFSIFHTRVSISRQSK